MKTGYFALILLISMGFVSALDMSVRVDQNTYVVDLQNPVVMIAQIKDAPGGLYNIYTLADVSVEPRENFNLEGDLIKEFTLVPFESLEYRGTYVFTVVLNHRGVEKVDRKVSLNIVDLEDIISVGSDFIDPESGEIKFYVKNKENVRLENLSVDINSMLFKSKETFSLEPYEKKVITVDVDDATLARTNAGVYVLKAVFDTAKGDKTIEGNMYLNENKDVSTTEKTSGFLIRTEEVTKVNTGNVDETVQIRISRNIFSRLFTTFNINPVVVDRDSFVVKYTWVREDLGPAETYKVKARTNYVLPVVVLILLILVVIGFRRFVKTSVEVKKSVSPVKTKSGEFALKIQLSVKAKKSIENVTVIDKVPAIVKIYKKFGILKPDKIDSESRRLHWNLGNLNSGEERIFSYIVYSKVGFVGKFVLPEALAVFERDEKVQEVASNQVFFLTDQIKGEQ